LILFSRHIVFQILPELIGIVSKTAYPAGLERQDYLTHSCQEKIFWRGCRQAAHARVKYALLTLRVFHRAGRRLTLHTVKASHARSLA
jgi:hypothetical protein